MGGIAKGHPTKEEIDAAYKAIRVEYNANNGSGKGGLCGRLMSLALYTDRWYTDQFYSAILPESTIYDWHHYALVWNVDGISAVSGNPVATILVDGVPRTQVDMSGWNKDSFVEAMQKPMVLGMSRFGDYNHGRSAYCIDELRIWDSDVTTFSSSPLPAGLRSAATTPTTSTAARWRQQ